MKWQAGLYLIAVLVPLFAFAVQAVFLRGLKRRCVVVATAAVGFSCLLSVIGFVDYFGFEAAWLSAGHGVQSGPGAREAETGPVVWRASADWVVLGGAAAGTEDRPGLTVAKPSLVIPLGIAVDNLGVIMFLMVTFVATLIHVYSIGYMHADPGYPRFFAYLSLFTFSMLGLVASSNLFMTFLFWELVGLCSYLLIGFWYQEKANCVAANKAFLVNRVGDLGMMVGLGLLWSTLGTLTFEEINQGLRDGSGQWNVKTGDEGRDVVVLQEARSGEPVVNPITQERRQIPMGLLTLAGLGIFAGCVGKSAQFPLHVWLPDAMAGPTPVSALIHAATMVAAGVFLVGRFYPLFTEEVLLVIAYTGGITLLIGATIAVVQTDYKQVLAYSTVSQLGFMMLGLGVGGWAAGLFHLVTHAFFKALLFLCAGSVYHSVHTYEMPELGGLLKKMPTTAYAMLVGTLAISGAPFFAGFYSKDAILTAALARVHESPEHMLLFVLPAIGGVLTAFYMFRLWLLIFSGESRSKHLGQGDPVARAYESPEIMTRPLVILAVCSIFVGWTVQLGLPPVIGPRPVLEQMLEYGAPAWLEQGQGPHWLALGASLAVAGIGAGLALLYYAPSGLPHFTARRLSAAHAAETYPVLQQFLLKKWYFDPLYAFLFVRPTRALARLFARFDQTLVDGLVNTAAAATALLSRLEGYFDQFAVDGLVNLLARAVYRLGELSRLIQTGRLRTYLLFLTIMLVGLFAGVIAWVHG